MLRGLRQAATMIAVAAAVATVAGAIWVAVTGDGFRSRFGLSLLVLGGLIAFVGGTLNSRTMTMDVYAFLGRGPGMDEPGEGEALTAVGVFLFVAVPLFVAGGVIYGAG